MRRPLTLSLLSALSLCACGMGLPLEERLASLRPLAFRTEILPATEDPIRAEGLPLERARIVPLFADAAGPLEPERVEAELEPAWYACTLAPFEGLFGCISRQGPSDPEDIPVCAFDVNFEPGDGDDPLAEIGIPPSPCRIDEGSPAVPEYTIPLDPGFFLGGDIEVTMVAKQPDSDTTTEACTRALLSADESIFSDCIFAVHRIPVGPDARLIELARDFGVPESSLPPVPETIPDADRNPRIEVFEVTVVGEDAAAWRRPLTSGERIRVPLGARIEIETRAPEEDLQTYLIPADDSYEERREAYEGRWYRTWGELLSPSSNDPRSINTWTLVRGPQDEDDAPPGGVATLIYVLRDGRSGVAWFWFEVEIAD